MWSPINSKASQHHNILDLATAMSIYEHRNGVFERLQFELPPPKLTWCEAFDTSSRHRCHRRQRRRTVLYAGRYRCRPAFASQLLLFYSQSSQIEVSTWDQYITLAMTGQHLRVPKNPFGQGRGERQHPNASAIPRKVVRSRSERNNS